MGGDTVSTIDDHDDRFPNLFDGMSFSEADENRINSGYAQVLKNYDDLKDRIEKMELIKTKIKVLRYTPGSWVENNVGDYNVPKTTTLVLIGPKGSGKSSLVNRISRAFEDDKFAPERAQVTYNSSIRDGTCFLHEYMVPRTSTCFCLYDTPGFSCENLDMVKQWMTKGVRNGEFVQSASDNSSLWARVKCKIRQETYERRRVDFVIFVVNGLSVLKCMESNGADNQYMHMVTQAFNSPILSFKDHKPVIAITHGDLLSISERVSIRVYLGHALGVHPSKQTFDIPDNCEPTTELTIVDLVRYALEHADRNLPCKSRPAINKGGVLWTHLILFLLAVVIVLFTHAFHSLPVEINKVAEFDQQSVPKCDMKINKVTEIVPKYILEMKKKVIPESEISKPGKKTKKAERKHSLKKVEPTVEIDWKTIRHVW